MENKRKLKTTEEEHLENKSQEVVDMFFILKEKISAFDKIKPKVTDPYIGYKFIGSRRSRLFVEIHLQKQRIELHLRSLEYNDPQNKIIQKPDSHRWTLDKAVYIVNKSEIDYVMPFIKQSYNDVCSNI